MTRSASALHILLVSHYFPPHMGGIENVVAGEARHLAETGHHVTVLTTAIGAPAGAQESPDGYRVVRVPAWNAIERHTGVPFPILSPRAMTAATKVIRDADVVHVHDVNYTTTWLAALLAWLLRRPLVLTQHVELITHPSRVVEGVQLLVHGTVGRVVVARARAIVYLNGRVAAFLTRLGADRDRLQFLVNGTDADRFHPVGDAEVRRELRASFGLPPDEVLALFAGRFVPKKGYDLVLASAGTGYVLVLAGGVAETGSTAVPGVVLLGPQPPDRMADLYRACDLLVLPSEAEGFPLTAQEAMASGLPVILADDPGYDEYELDRDLVTFVDRSVVDVRAALLRLAGDPVLRTRMAAYSAQVAHDRFGWDEHVRGLGRLYVEVLGRSRSWHDRSHERRRTARQGSAPRTRRAAGGDRLRAPGLGVPDAQRRDPPVDDRPAADPPRRVADRGRRRTGLVPGVGDRLPPDPLVRPSAQPATDRNR